jgi:excisionase family DNA binding protein
MKKVFTTGQVAKICKVAPRTVSKWFDSGRLRGYRIPGSQDRRIPREQLIRFLKEHGMPLGELEEEGWHKILIIGADKLLIDRIKELLPEDDEFKYELANSGFEAGIQAESFHPDTIIIDLAMGRSEGLQIAQNLRKNPHYEQTLIVALASEDEAEPEGLVNHGFSESFKKPFDVALLGERIQTLVEEKRRERRKRVLLQEILLVVIVVALVFTLVQVAVALSEEPSASRTIPDLWSLVLSTQV